MFLIEIKKHKTLGELPSLKRKKNNNKQAEYKSQPSRTFNLIRFEKERLEALKRSFERKIYRRRGKKTPAIILKLAKKKKKSRNLELLQPIAKSSRKQGTVIISHLDGGNNPNELNTKKKHGGSAWCQNELFISIVFSFSNRSSTGDLKGWIDVVDITCRCLNNKPLFLRLSVF